MNGYNFTDSVRRSLQQARTIASERQNEYVGPEHILLGMLATPDPVITSILQQLNVAPDLLIQMVDALAKRGDRPTRTGPELPYTSRAKKSLELAMLEARELGDSYVGDEHLLLGLIREEKGIAAQVLTATGVTHERAREALGRMPGEAAPFDAGTAMRNARVEQEAARRAALDALPQRMRLALIVALLALLVAVIALVRTL